MAKKEDVQEFTYTSLPNSSTHIRLLRFQPAKDDNDMVCALSTHEVERAPAYSAISYTWGDPLSTRKISMNGLPLEVRWNCYYALWQARQYGAEYVWIDAICINQDDLDEKSSQVQMMGQIYEKAGQVLVCIGPETDDSRVVFGSFGGCPQDQSPLSWRSWLRMIHSTRGTDYFARLCQAITSFAQRPYWSRVWIVQELAVAKHAILLCKDSTLEWMLLFCLVAHLREPIVSDYEASSLIHNAIVALRGTTLHSLVRALRPEKFSDQVPFALPAMLENFCAFRCSNSLDHVYGFLYLVNWDHSDNDQVQGQGRRPLQVDYTKSPITLAKECLHLLKTRIASDVSMSAYWIKAPLRALQLLPSQSPVRDLIENRRRYFINHAIRPANRHIDSMTVQTSSKSVEISTDHRIHKYNFKFHGKAVELRDSGSGALTCNLEMPDSLTDFDHGKIVGDVLNSAYASELKEKVSHLKPTKMMHGQTFLGLLCPGAQPGDFLLSQFCVGQTESSRYRLCLILRRSHGPFFEIVGQAVMDQAWAVCLGGGQCECDGIQHDRCMSVDVLFHDEDLLTYAAQSLMAEPRQGLASVESDVEAPPELEQLALRLYTGIVHYPLSSYAVCL